MKSLKIFLITIFLTGCASTVHTPYGQKKASFNPNWDTDCVIDKTVSSGWMNGFACANDNGVQYIRHTTTKFKMTSSEMQKRAQRYCAQYDKKAVHKGKANMCFSCKLDWTGEEYLCM